MLTVEDYARIRRAYRDGLKIRAIARTLHHSRRKIREALGEAEPRRYTRTQPPPAPKLGPFFSIIDQILAADEQAPAKQRHTARQVFRRLVGEHGYTGGYDQVRRYIGCRRRQTRETFIPLAHAPGQRAEADFGHIYVDFPEGRRQVPVLLATWAYSYCPFAIALPTERVEAILHGLVAAWEFFDAAPRELWWDNPTTVAVQIFPGRRRRVNERYQALASHYNFEPLFCLPGRGNEKPHVENRVKNLQRRWATPVPRVANLAELNASLRQCCLEDRERVATGEQETIGARFERDRGAALPLPPYAFDPCVMQPAKVDKYQTVQFDSNRYSVPRSHAFQTVSVKAYIDRVVILSAGQVVAQHVRSYDHGHQILDPLHYLVTLGRKPACVDHTAVYRQWSLPPAFSQWREATEALHGAPAGTRQYVRVLQLLAHHPAERLAQALECCLARQMLDVESVARCAERLRHQHRAAAIAPVDLGPESIDVPLPDLCRFDQLLAPGELTDVPELGPTAEGQLATAAAADHGGRM
jgi:transposase